MINEKELIELSNLCKTTGMPIEVLEDLKHQEEIHPEEVPYYKFLYLLSSHVKPKLCVELGTNRGMGAGCLALGSPDGRVVTLDIERKNMYKSCDLPNIDYWIQDSLAEPKEDLKDIDILFIDTSSKGSQNKKEYDFWIHRVKDDGIVIIDDIFIVKDKDGNITTDLMAEFWREFSPEGKKVELPLHGANGFGVVLLDKDKKTQSHTDLKDIYKGKDVYVLGSGQTTEFIDPSFFENKITIGANSVWKFFPVKYSVFKHKEFIEEAIKNGQKVIISKHDCGDTDHSITENEHADYVFTHKKGRFDDLEANFKENLDVLGQDDDIFVSYSTITSAIHLAAYMGAKNIILAGHDCGYIDKKSHVKDYAEHIENFYGTEDKFIEYHNDWFDRINGDTERLKRKLKEVYGCNIYSLNPFINLRLEGHVYDTKK